jgi:hypothetical protein
MTLTVNIRESTGSKNTASGYLLLQCIRGDYLILYFEGTRFVTRPEHPLCSGVIVGLATISEDEACKNLQPNEQ